MDDITLRTTFDSEAELYNEARPRYPAELFGTLVKITQLPANAQLLEIGPGTGQATRPLAERGYQITAIELGGTLAEVARRELKGFKNVEVITSPFEEVDLAAQSFDLIYSATAFHWIKPEVRFTKPHQLLKAGGHLAIIHTHHLAYELDDSFFHASRPIYKKYESDRPKSTKDFMVVTRRGLEDVTADTVDENLFKPIHFQVFPLAVKHSAEDYMKLIGTFSPTLAMPRESRVTFLQELGDLINQKFGGSITKNYGMSLTISQKIG